MHADIRVSLREVQEGQRDFGAFEQVEGDRMPEVRFDEAGEEAVGVCVVCGGFAKWEAGKAEGVRRFRRVRGLRMRTEA